MAAERPEKGKVRELWLEAVKQYHPATQADDVLYLTLPGPDGKDIRMLIEAGLVDKTESGGIAAHHASRVAAVENDLPSVLELQRSFPGLQIFNQQFQDLVRGERLIRYPDGRHERFCRARVVNLDLNQVLQASNDPGTFPVLTWIQKLGEMHATPPRIDWCLCLTLHGELHWNDATTEMVRTFLRENFGKSAVFAEAAQGILGKPLFETISGKGDISLPDLPRTDQQKLLMLFVPKKIVHLVSVQGWKVEVTANLRYGQPPQHAPMVTWIMRFEYSQTAVAAPDATYVNNLEGILARSGLIDGDGNVIHD